MVYVTKSMAAVKNLVENNFIHVKLAYLKNKYWNFKWESNNMAQYMDSILIFKKLTYITVNYDIF